MILDGIRCFLFTLISVSWLCTHAYVDLNSFVCLQVSNLIYVDQPTGTGFSYSSDDRDIRHNEEEVSNDLYDFLQVSLLYVHMFVLVFTFQ